MRIQNSNIKNQISKYAAYTSKNTLDDFLEWTNDQKNDPKKDINNNNIITNAEINNNKKSKNNLDSLVVNSQNENIKKNNNISEKETPDNYKQIEDKEKDYSIKQIINTENNNNINSESSLRQVAGGITSTSIQKKENLEQTFSKKEEKKSKYKSFDFDIDELYNCSMSINKRKKNTDVSLIVENHFDKIKEIRKQGGKSISPAKVLQDLRKKVKTVNLNNEFLENSENSG